MREKPAIWQEIFFLSVDNTANERSHSCPRVDLQNVFIRFKAENDLSALNVVTGIVAINAASLYTFSP